MAEKLNDEQLAEVNGGSVSLRFWCKDYIANTTKKVKPQCSNCRHFRKSSWLKGECILGHNGR